MTTKKPIIWMGGSRSDLSKMPDAVRKGFGGALDGVQQGRTPTDAKSLKGKIKGALQLSEHHDGETYRAVYTIELESAVCFQKKWKNGIATPQTDIDLIERRLKDARVLHAQLQRKKP